MVTPILNDHNSQNQLVDRYHWLGEPEKLPFEFSCTHLVHYTENESAKKIGNVAQPNDFCFKAFEWTPRRDLSIKYLTWWTAVPPENWEDTVASYIPNSLHGYNFPASPAFNGESICGPIGFAVSWKDILEQYAKSRKEDYSKIQLKVLGTFKYTREIMYAILVCIDGDNIKYKDKYGNESEFTLLGDETKETEAFRYTKNEETFTWKVYSVTSGWAPTPNGYKTWDHLSFAFYFPEKDGILKIPPNLCRIETKFASELCPYSRIVKSGRTLEERCAYGELVHELKEKISYAKLHIKKATS